MATTVRSPGHASLVAALAIRDLVSAGSADDAVARALLAKRNAVVQTAVEEGRAQGRTQGRAEGRAQGRTEGRTQGRAEGRAQAIVAISVARGLTPQQHERDLILATDDDDVLTRWLAAVATCTSVAELLDTSRG